MGLNVAILPVDIKNILISAGFTPYDFSSRCKPSAHTLFATEKVHKLWFDKNQTHDSVLAGVQLIY